MAVPVTFTSDAHAMNDYQRGWANVGKNLASLKQSRRESFGGNVATPGPGL